MGEKSHFHIRDALYGYCILQTLKKKKNHVNLTTQKFISHN